MSHKLFQRFAFFAVLFAAISVFGQAEDMIHVKPSSRGPMQALKNAGYPMSLWNFSYSTDKDGVIFRVTAQNASKLRTTDILLPKACASGLTAQCRAVFEGNKNLSNGDENAAAQIATQLEIVKVHYRAAVSKDRKNQDSKPPAPSFRTFPQIIDLVYAPSRIPGLRSSHDLDSDDQDPEVQKLRYQNLRYLDQITRNPYISDDRTQFRILQRLMNVSADSAVCIPDGYDFNPAVKIKGVLRLKGNCVAVYKSFSLLMQKTDGTRECWAVVVDWQEAPPCRAPQPEAPAVLTAHESSPPSAPAKQEQHRNEAAGTEEFNTALLNERFNSTPF
jgi:hypothetical protein